jgi:hypothetical protein
MSPYDARRACLEADKGYVSHPEGLEPGGDPRCGWVTSSLTSGGYAATPAWAGPRGYTRQDWRSRPGALHPPGFLPRNSENLGSAPACPAAVTPPRDRGRPGRRPPGGPG